MKQYLINICVKIIVKYKFNKIFKQIIFSEFFFLFVCETRLHYNSLRILIKDKIL